MPDKVLAFYIRLSSEDRDLKTNALKNESNSVFNQRRLLQDYYDTHESLHGYKVIVFCDDGVTGTHFDRPKFDELIEMARNQEIHCIMVKDLSRFGRNFLEMGNYLELILPLYGVRFISINDAFDRAEEIKRLLVEQYESRGNLAAGKRTADQIILLKDYDPEIIRNFVERVRVYPSGEIEIDMRTSSGFAFVTAS